MNTTSGEPSGHDTDPGGCPAPAIAGAPRALENIATPADAALYRAARLGVRSGSKTTWRSTRAAVSSKHHGASAHATLEII